VKSLLHFDGIVDGIDVKSIPDVFGTHASQPGVGLRKQTPAGIFFSGMFQAVCLAT
jgi:hypothetical protein